MRPQSILGVLSAALILLSVSGCSKSPQEQAKDTAAKPASADDGTGSNRSSHPGAGLSARH